MWHDWDLYKHMYMFSLFIDYGFLSLDGIGANFLPGLNLFFTLDPILSPILDYSFREISNAYHFCPNRTLFGPTSRISYIVCIYFCPSMWKICLEIHPIVTLVDHDSFQL